MPTLFTPHSRWDKEKSFLFHYQAEIYNLFIYTYDAFNTADPNGTQDACHNWTLYWPTSPKSLCDSVVEQLGAGNPWISGFIPKRDLGFFLVSHLLTDKNSRIFFSHRRYPVPVSYHFNPLTSMSDWDRMTFLTISIQDQPDKWRE